MKNVLRGYVGSPAEVRRPEKFAEMLQIAGGNLRQKVVSVMTAADWQEHKRLCQLAVAEERQRNGSDIIPADQERARLRVETTAFVVRKTVLEVLTQAGEEDVALLEMAAEADRMDVGAGYTLRRRKGSMGYTFHNHQPESGFPVDMVVETGDEGLILMDVTGSHESYHANIETEGPRMVQARKLVEAQRLGTGPRYDLHLLDVLVNDGEGLNPLRQHKPQRGVHTAILPLRSEAYAMADKLVGKV